MRILHVIPYVTVGYGGPVTTMMNMIRVWQSDGISAEVIAIVRNEAELTLNFAVNMFPPSFPARFGASRGAARWLEAHYKRFDLVIFHSIWSLINLELSAILRSNARPYLVIAHGSLDPFDLQKKALAKQILGPILVRPYLNGASAIVCSTPREAQSLVTYNANVPVRVLPWAVEMETALVDRDTERKRLEFGPDEFVVLFLGRLDYKKGFPVLIPAIRLLRDSGIRVKLMIVGPETRNYGEKVRELVAANRLDDCVVFHPPAMGAEKVRLMHAADCFALTSLNENFGNAVVEAMQQGLPVVVSENVYISDSVRYGGAGLVCRYDESDVFHCLSRLAGNLELREEMSKAARLVGASYLPCNLRDQYLALICAPSLSDNREK